MQKSALRASADQILLHFLSPPLRELRANRPCFQLTLIIVSWVYDDVDTRSSSRNSLESALDLFGGRSGAIREEPPCSALRGNQPTIRKQFRIIYNSRRVPIFDRSRLGHRLDGGGEHEVYLAEDISTESSWRIYKETHPNHAGQYGRAVNRVDGAIRVATDDATPAEYLERMLLHNEVFGDSVRLEGISESGNSLVISQPYIQGKIPERSRTNQFVQQIGFDQIADGFWYSQQRTVAITDTKPANFIETDDGGIHPIDIAIFVPSRAMLQLWDK